jgi:cardiolipin synthase
MPEGAPPTKIIRPRAAPVLNLANAVTVARICAAPLAIWLVLDHSMAPAFGLFALAGLSDALDGWLARRHGGSALGAMLDPLADKALLIGMFVALAAIGVLPGWLAILVVLRDGAILAGAAALWLMGGLHRVRPMGLSKLNTALQIVLVGAALLMESVDMRFPAVLTGLIVLVATSTLVSGAAYVVRTAR